jgi:hypothetical protein
MSAASGNAYRPEPVLAQPEDGTAEVTLCFNLLGVGAIKQQRHAQGVLGYSRRGWFSLSMSRVCASVKSKV